MTGKYTNNLQAAILYEGGGEICPPVHLNAFRMEMLNRQIPLNIVQEARNFVFMRGPGELQIMVTYFPRPADAALFEPTLGSAVTTLLMKDARERVGRHTTHVLIEIHHGVLAGAFDNPEAAGFLSQIGMPRPGTTQREFSMRVDILGEVCRHPAGILTLGAADYIGREIYVAPAPVPWVDLYDTVLAFTRVALMPNGYIIPDDETFGPESGEFTYLVRHLKAEEHPMGMREPTYGGSRKPVPRAWRHEGRRRRDRS